MDGETLEIRQSTAGLHSWATVRVSRHVQQLGRLQVAPNWYWMSKGDLSLYWKNSDWINHFAEIPDFKQQAAVARNLETSWTTRLGEKRCLTASLIDFLIGNFFVDRCLTRFMVSSVWSKYAWTWFSLFQRKLPVHNYELQWLSRHFSKNFQLELETSWNLLIMLASREHVN